MTQQDKSSHKVGSLNPCRRCQKGFFSDKLPTEITTIMEINDGSKVKLYSRLCEPCSNAMEIWLSFGLASQDDGLGMET